MINPMPHNVHLPLLYATPTQKPSAEQLSTYSPLVHIKKTVFWSIHFLSSPFYQKPSKYQKSHIFKLPDSSKHFEYVKTSRLSNFYNSLWNHAKNRHFTIPYNVTIDRFPSIIWIVKTKTDRMDYFNNYKNLLQIFIDRWLTITMWKQMSATGKPKLPIYCFECHISKNIFIEYLSYWNMTFQPASRSVFAW